MKHPRFHECPQCHRVKRSEAVRLCARCEWLAIVLKVGVAGAGAPILAEIFAQFEERILALEERDETK